MHRHLSCFCQVSSHKQLLQEQSEQLNLITTCCATNKEKQDSLIQKFIYLWHNSRNV